MNLLTNLINLIEDHQGQDVAILDMRKVSPFMDYMLVSHVSNPRLLGALANYVTDYLAQQGINYSPIEGKEDSKWLLIDANEVVVHLFLEEERSVYNLEKLWSDCLVSKSSLGL